MQVHVVAQGKTLHFLEVAGVGKAGGFLCGSCGRWG